MIEPQITKLLQSYLKFPEKKRENQSKLLLMSKKIFKSYLTDLTIMADVSVG